MIVSRGTFERMGRTAIRRRYLSLGLGELAAAASVGVVWYLVVRRYDDTATVVVALAVLAWVLVQGGAYWLVALRWIPGGRMPSSVASIHRVFRIVNIGMLAGAAAGIVWWFPSSSVPARVFGVLLWLFAVAEYVNYFWVRLSYPSSQWVTGVRAWRPSRLARDLSAPKR